jgi:hypothetical protein
MSDVGKGKEPAPEWLRRILDAAEPADAVELIRHLDRLDRAAWPAWRVRAERLRERDACVRAAVASLAASNGPKELARLLKHRAVVRSRAPFGTPEGLLDRILALSGDKPLSARQIAAIAASRRDPVGSY